MSKVEQLTTINGRLSRDNDDYKKSNSKLLEDNKKFIVSFLITSLYFFLIINFINFVIILVRK